MIAEWYNSFNFMKTSAALFLTDILPLKRKWYNKAIKNKIFAKNSPKQVFEHLKSCGVDGIELFLPMYSKMKFVDITDVKKLLDEVHVPVLSVHQTIRFVTKTKISEITRLFHIADMLSAKIIVLHMSSVGKQIFDKDYIDTLHSLQEKYGIKVGFENREKFFGSYFNGHSWHEEKFPDLMKKCNFYITLDTTHLAQAGGNIITFFKNNKERIVNIHLSDYRPHYLNNSLRPLRYKHLPLGEGRLPIKKFIETLKEEDYKGLVTMEIHTDLKGICESARVINAISKSSN